MAQNFIPRDISPITHFIRFEERSEQGQGGLVICDKIRQFYHDCGHVSIRTSCHNWQNIQLLQHATQNFDPPPHYIYPCMENLCNQSVTFDRYVQGSCPDCGRRGLGSSLVLNPPFNGSTVTRSDPYSPLVPANVVAGRRGTYRVLAMHSLFRLIGILLDDSSSFLEAATGIAGGDDLFIPYELQFDPGALSNELERNLLDAWLYHRGCEEDRRQIPPLQRGYYVCAQQQNTPLLSTVEPTDNGVAGEQCMICQDPEFLLEEGDPRRLPCGHMFHWVCIAGWIYQPGTNTCPYCRQEYFITDLWISPM